jgi:flagellar basal body rod protein FlgB
MKISGMGQSEHSLYGLHLDAGPMKSLSSMLAAISDRQRVTSNNLANAATPGYTAQEVKFSDILGQADNPFDTALSQKMGTLQSSETNTGQPVNIQKELIEMQKNLLFYNMATRRISTVITGFKTASQIGR